MSEAKHFSYAGNVHVRDVRTPPPEGEVVDVVFLTPARVTVRAGGADATHVVAVDIVNRRVYDAQGKPFLGAEVFAYLDAVNSLPEDFFAAPQEVRDLAADLDADRARQQREFLGDADE